jgi:hypothetical protein
MCFVLKNVLNFAMPAKPESGCQKTLLNGLLGLCGDDKADGIGKVISATIEISARENYRPPRPLMSCGIVRIPNLRSSSTAFLIFGEIFREGNNLTGEKTLFAASRDRI